MRNYILLGLVAISAFCLGFAIYFAQAKNVTQEPTTFEQCVEQNNIVLEIYPRQCRTKSGRTFTEIVSMPSLKIANPASVYCEENGGILEIRINSNGGQTGFCVFENGKECEEWEYFRKECTQEVSIQPNLTD